MKCSSATNLGLTSKVFIGILSLSLSIATFANLDEEALGKSLGYPTPPRPQFPIEEKYKVGTYSNRDSLGTFCVIQPSVNPVPLPKSNIQVNFRYLMNGANLTIEDYLNRQRATGLVVVKDGEILFERFNYLRNENHRLLSSSMAKTIVALAVGQALSDKHIESLEDTAGKYVEELRGSFYGRVKIIDLLRMSSGLAFNEVMNGQDDLAKVHRAISELGTAVALEVLMKYLFLAAKSSIMFQLTARSWV
jgi:hypothetical protein